MQESLAYIDTIYSADSIEFCPHSSHAQYFTCGTYQLVPVVQPNKKSDTIVDDNIDSDRTQKNHMGDKVETGKDDNDSDTDDDEITPPAPRIGRLYLYSLDGETITQVDRHETAAILDAKWSPIASPEPELAVADAKGGVTLYTLGSVDSETPACLTQRQRLEVSDQSTLVLSLDHGHGSDREVMTSLSSGELAHLVRTDTGQLAVNSTWPAHDFEPWITAWGSGSAGESVVWSGGDDCKLKRWDLRDTSRPTFVNKRFDAGVTTIAPSPHHEHLLAVGSYDEHLRIFDVRAPASPILDIELPGGIWRTRWHPSASRSGDILNACMHGGFAVAHIPGHIGGTLEGTTEASIVARFEGELGYGADWCRLDDGSGTSLVATCSFYDHAMHLWRA